MTINISLIISKLERISELASEVAKDLRPGERVQASVMRFYVMPGGRLRCRRGNEQWFYAPEEERWKQEPPGDISVMDEWKQAEVSRTFGHLVAMGPTLDELPF